MERNIQAPLPRCCRKHLHQFKKDHQDSKTHEMEFTCNHCMRSYSIERIEHPDLNAGEDGWGHPMLIKERKVA